MHSIDRFDLQEALIQRFAIQTIGEKLSDIQRQDLSPGLSQSKIFRITGATSAGASHRFILKIPDYGSAETALRLSDTFVAQREQHFFDSTLPNLIRSHIRIPKMLFPSIIQRAKYRRNRLRIVKRIPTTNKEARMRILVFGGHGFLGV